MLELKLFTTQSHAIYRFLSSTCTVHPKVKVTLLYSALLMHLPRNLGGHRCLGTTAPDTRRLGADIEFL